MIDGKKGQKLTLRERAAKCGKGQGGDEMKEENLERWYMREECLGVGPQEVWKNRLRYISNLREDNFTKILRYQLNMKQAFQKKKNSPIFCFQGYPPVYPKTL